MSLNHEFVIVDDLNKSNWTNLTSDFFENKDTFEYVSVHDDYISYFADFISFFTMHNPCKNDDVEGLCYYGVTKIPNEKLSDIIKFLEHLLGIFTFAPDEIHLKGEYITEYSETPNAAGYYEDGHYEMLKISKEKMLKKLQSLINLFTKAKVEDKCIMHCGI